VTSAQALDDKPRRASPRLIRGPCLRLAAPEFGVLGGSVFVEARPLGVGEHGEKPRRTQNNSALVCGLSREMARSEGKSKSHLHRSGGLDTQNLTKESIRNVHNRVAQPQAVGRVEHVCPEPQPIAFKKLEIL